MNAATFWSFEPDLYNCKTHIVSVQIVIVLTDLLNFDAKNIRIADDYSNKLILCYPKFSKYLETWKFTAVFWIWCSTWRKRKLLVLQTKKLFYKSLSISIICLDSWWLKWSPESTSHVKSNTNKIGATFLILRNELYKYLQQKLLLNTLKYHLASQ